MRSDNLKKHKCIYCNYQSDRPRNVRRHVEKKHPEHKPSQKEVTQLQKEVCEKIGYPSTLDVVALKNSVMYQSGVFMRKLELGRELMRIITEENIMKACLSKENMEALELFEKHGQANDVKPVRP